MYPMDEHILEISKVSNSYNGEPLLKSISFSLFQGEILSLLGPSGSGKTTLLRVLAGLELEEEGTIIFDGRNLRSIAPHKRNIGMMFQEYALFPHKNVWENIAFGLEMKKMADHEVAGKVEEMIALVGLEGLANRRVDELSGGERQRVALARSLAPEPKLLLLDEPLGSLDRTLRDRLTHEIRSILKKLGVTSVFVTHDQAEAFSIADKIGILLQGQLQQFDIPETIYRSPITSQVAQFLGFTNLIPGKLCDNGIFHSQIGTITTGKEAVIDQEGILLLRPDGAQICGEIPEETKELVLHGIVQKRVFQGSSYRLDITVKDFPLRFDVSLEPSPPEAGNEIELFIPLTSIEFLYQ